MLDPIRSAAPSPSPGRRRFRASPRRCDGREGECACRILQTNPPTPRAALQSLPERPCSAPRSRRNRGQGPAGPTPASAPTAAMPSGYNILFVLVDQEHFFPNWPFPVPAREAIKKKAVTFLNHQAASCVCSSARSVDLHRPAHPAHRHRRQSELCLAARSVDQASRPSAIGLPSSAITPPIRASGISRPSSISPTRRSTRRCGIPRDHASYGFKDFFGIGDLIDGTLGGYSYDDTTLASAITLAAHRGARRCAPRASPGTWRSISSIRMT